MSQQLTSTITSSGVLHFRGFFCQVRSAKGLTEKSYFLVFQGKIKRPQSKENLFSIDRGRQSEIDTSILANILHIVNCSGFPNCSVVRDFRITQQKTTTLDQK